MSRTLLSLVLVLMAAPLAAAAPTPAQPRVRSLVSDLNPLVGSAVEQCLEIEYRDLPRQPASIDWPLAEGFVINDLPPRPLRRIRLAGAPRLLESVCRRLVPLRAGALSLPAARISRGGQTLRGGAMTLQVQPLPVAGRPAKFSGAVGDVSLSLTQVRDADGGRRYDLTLAGDGPLDLFPRPQPSPDQGQLQLVQDTTRRRGDGRLERDFSYRADYENPGPVRFSLWVFDPNSGSYRQLTAGSQGPALPWPVTAGLAMLGAAAVALTLGRRRRSGSPEAQLAAWAGVVPNALDRDAALQRLAELGLDPLLLEPLRRYLQRDTDRFTPQIPLPDSRQGVRIQPLNRRKLRKAIDKLGPYRR